MEIKEKIINPLFILGCPRSGTTLLASFFDNSSYGAPIETHFITKYYKKLDSYGNLKSKDNLSRLIKDILCERPVMQRDVQINIDEFYNELTEYSYKEIVNKICMLIAMKMGFKSWGDKTPHYIMDLDIIYELFPDSKYIYIVRDGRDVALSLLEREWGPNNMLACAEYWKKCNAENEIIDKLKDKKQLYFVRYEDLIDNAKQILPEIYAFLDERYDHDKMMSLISRIKRGNYNKWKDVMSNRQLKLFESVASNTLKRFDYEFSYEQKAINSLVSGFFKFHSTVSKAIFLFKINVIDTVRIKFFGKQPFAD